MNFRWIRLRDWLESPGLSSRNDRGVAESLRAIGVTFLITVVIIWVSSYATSETSPRPTGQASLATAMVLILCSLVLVQIGRLRAAAWVLIAMTWISTTVGVAGAGGIQLPGVSFYAISIVAAGLLLGSRAALATALMSIAAAGVLAIFQSQDLLPEPYVFYDRIISYWLMYAVLFGSTAGLVYISDQSHS